MKNFSNWIVENKKNSIDQKKQFVQSVLDKYGKKMPPIDSERYNNINGLEGPFRLRSGKIAYYDPKEGKYYDRDSDVYMSHDDYNAHQNPKTEWSDLIRTGSEEEAEDRDLKMLNSQMQNVLSKLLNLVSKMKNKNKGYALLHQIGQTIQSATGASDTNMRKALFGQLPNQK
jgi:hypothetical protein